VELQFLGNYNEPKLIIEIPKNLLVSNNNKIELKLTFNPCGRWE